MEASNRMKLEVVENVLDKLWSYAIPEIDKDLEMARNLLHEVLSNQE